MVLFYNGTPVLSLGTLLKVAEDVSVFFEHLEGRKLSPSPVPTQIVAAKFILTASIHAGAPVTRFLTMVRIVDCRISLVHYQYSL